MKTHLQKIFFLLFLILTIGAFGQVRLPKLISNGLILQRDAKVKIWGWAAANEKITIDFLNKKHNVTANTQGEWELQLTNLKAGGPYVMKIVASNNLEINDILVGDVWLCSGQSNMAMTVGSVASLYENDIANSENNFIRNFELPREYEFSKPRTDFSGGSWKKANPKDVKQFSAAAYFFAKELYSKYKIPIGMINASFGGTPIHAWISEKDLKPFPESYNEIANLKNPVFVKDTEKNDIELEKNWSESVRLNDEGSASKGNWIANSFNIQDWQEIKIPGLWNDSSLDKVNGVIWLKKEIEVSKNTASTESLLKLGAIIGDDFTYINGKLIGNSFGKWATRKYTIPANTLTEGKNTITIKVISKNGTSGFIKGHQYAIVGKEETIDLSNSWKYKIGHKLEPLPASVQLKWKPTAMYNSMIEPLKKYSFKGAIWYQGEGNSGKPKEYGQLLPALITNWRAVFNHPKMPFLFVQLPNYGDSKPNPTQSNWAELRESQLKTLSLPYTGMATTIDVGDWKDIHPHKKKEVGTRLALVAQNKVYGDSKVLCYGPVYKSMKVENGKIHLSFDTVGSAMQFKGEGKHTNFAVAGEDKKFVWAEAKIENGKIIVWSDKITNPVAVRYAWSDNIEGEILYNSKEIPASPFRTDSW